MPRKKWICICISPIFLFHSRENNCRLSRSLFVQGHMENSALKGVLLIGKWHLESLVCASNFDTAGKDVILT